MDTKLIIHLQTSLDGRIRGFEHPEIFYQVAAQMPTDAVLFGSNTIRMAFTEAPEGAADDFIQPAPSPNDPRPLGIIVDSRGILRNFGALWHLGYLRGIVVLVSEVTPKDYTNYLSRHAIPYVKAGSDHVDFAEAFRLLREHYACASIRTDCGATLVNALLSQGVAQEISLIVSPCLVGTGEPSLFESLSLPQKLDLELLSCETVESGYLALRYRVPERP